MGLNAKIAVVLLSSPLFVHHSCPIIFSIKTHYIITFYYFKCSALDLWSWAHMTGSCGLHGSHGTRDLGACFGILAADTTKEGPVFYRYTPTPASWKTLGQGVWNAPKCSSSIVRAPGWEGLAADTAGLQDTAGAPQIAYSDEVLEHATPSL